MAEWPCCHDPLRSSPASHGFVPPPSTLAGRSQVGSPRDRGRPFGTARRRSPAQGQKQQLAKASWVKEQQFGQGVQGPKQQFGQGVREQPKSPGKPAFVRLKDVAPRAKTAVRQGVLGQKQQFGQGVREQPKSPGKPAFVRVTDVRLGLKQQFGKASWRQG